MSIDLDILANYQVLWFVNLSLEILVLAPFKEFTCWKSRVFGWWLVNLETIVVEVISDDEFTNSILRFGITEHCVKPQTDLLVYPFEEILLWRFRNQFVNVAQWILFRADSIVRRNDYS